MLARQPRAVAVTVTEGWSARTAGKAMRDLPHPAPLNRPVASSLIRNQPRTGLIISSASPALPEDVD